MKMQLIHRHIECIIIYLKSQDCKQYTARFVHSGGMQLILQILENRKKHSYTPQCLEVIQIVIRANPKFKQIVCMNGGIEMLLNMITDPMEEPDHDLSYCLYDTMKQLCLRNDAYLPSIHRSVIECILQNTDNPEAVGSLLKVLQSTMSFDDDIDVITATNTNTNANNTQIYEKNGSKNEISEQEMNENQDIMNADNVRKILKLLELNNHQIIYECLVNICIYRMDMQTLLFTVHSLFDVLFRSQRVQMIVIKSIMDLINISNGDKKSAYIDFAESIIKRNAALLTSDTKQILVESDCELMNCVNLK